MLGTPGLQEEGPAVGHYRCLADLIIGRPPARPIGGEAEWIELIALAVSEGVALLLAHKLQTRPQVDMPASAAERLKAIYSTAVFVGLLYRSVRERLCLVYSHPANSAVVERHWELHRPKSIQRTALPEIWAQAQPAPGDIPAQVMRAGHMVPLACAHMTLQHKCAPLLWLHDVHLILLTMDTEEAARAREAATRWRLGPAPARSLLRVQELFDTPLPGDLTVWAAETAAHPGGLQARVATLALTPRAAGMPDNRLLNLIMNRDWRFLRSLFPPPAVVRERLHLTPHQSVILGYLTLMTRRARHVPAQVRLFCRFWRPTPPPHPPQPTRRQGGRQ